jgi:uncharacterized membrane protein
MKKTIRAFLAAILCFTLVIGVFVMTGCDQNESNGSEQEDTDGEKKNDGKENDEKDENDENKSEKLSVVVLRNAVAKGARISSRDICLNIFRSILYTLLHTGRMLGLCVTKIRVLR